MNPRIWILVFSLTAAVQTGAGITAADSTARPAEVGIAVPGVPPEMRLAVLPESVPAPLANPTTAAKVALGRLLFFDPVLSSTRDVSCATCHHPRFGWADGRGTPIGTGGMGLGPERTFRVASSPSPPARNTPSLLNVGFNGLVAGVTPDPVAAPMFWDVREHGLEPQVFTPLRSRGEMRDDDCAEEDAVTRAVARVQAVGRYRELFREAFGPSASDAVNAPRIAQALAAFERSLVTPRTAVDRFIGGDRSALNPLQRQGLRAFQESGCIHCHGGPMYSDFKLHFLGVSTANAGDRREFRTPSLRNLGHTAPYLHDGSRRTVRDVLVFYDELTEAVTETLDGGDALGQPRLDPLLKHLRVDPDDFPALEAFLEALDSDEYDHSVPAVVPSGLPVTP